MKIPVNSEENGYGINIGGMVSKENHKTLEDSIMYTMIIHQIFIIMIVEEFQLPMIKLNDEGLKFAFFHEISQTLFKDVMLSSMKG